MLGLDSSDDFLLWLSRPNPPSQGPLQQPVSVAPLVVQAQVVVDPLAVDPLAAQLMAVAP